MLELERNPFFHPLSSLNFYKNKSVATWALLHVTHPSFSQICCIVCRLSFSQSFEFPKNLLQLLKSKNLLQPFKKPSNHVATFWILSTCCSSQFSQILLLLYSKPWTIPFLGPLSIFPSRVRHLNPVVRTSSTWTHPSSRSGRVPWTNRYRHKLGTWYFSAVASEQHLSTSVQQQQALYHKARVFTVHRPPSTIRKERVPLSTMVFIDSGRLISALPGFLRAGRKKNRIMT